MLLWMFFCLCGKFFRSLPGLNQEPDKVNGLYVSAEKKEIFFHQIRIAWCSRDNKAPFHY